MKINASHRLLAETLQDYVQRLSDQGIKDLGSGSFAYVFQHPTMPDVVVKLLHDNDPGYLGYVQFCRTKGRDNPYCPKIIQMKRADKMFDAPSLVHYTDMTLVFMEKLRPINVIEYRAFAKHCAASINDLKLFVNDGASLLSWEETWKKLGRQKQDPKLAEVARFLYSRSQTAWDLDLHIGNVMKRGTQIVITDPFSS